MTDGNGRRSLSNMLASKVLPGRYLAAQLRRPSGRFGRWVMTRGLNNGNAALIEATLRAAAPAGDDSVLDVGFGGGLGLRRAAELCTGPLLGVDFSADVVVEGQRSLAGLVASGRLNLLTGDVAALPLRDGLVDVLITTNTIYFWPDLGAGLAELRRVLRPGGRLAVGYTGRAKMERFEAVTQHGFRTFEPAEVEAALVDAGFVDVVTTDLHGKLIEGEHVTFARRAAVA